VYKLIAKNNRNKYCISVISLIQSILMSFILNYWKNCKSNNASQDIFIYKYINLIINNCKYIFAIEKTKKI